MNQLQTQPHIDHALEHAVQTGGAVSLSSNKGSKLSPQNLGEVVRFAEIMSKAGVALPAHLRDQPGVCMAVALQALEWDMSPFAVASKSYVVNGIIAYEAQLIAAVVNTRSGIQGRLKYRFDGEGNDLRCTVVGTIDGDELIYESPRKADIKIQNSPLWKNDPQQQLGYYSARAWARRHTPEVLLGVYDREEAGLIAPSEQPRDITPTVPISQRLQQANPVDTGEGFDEQHIDHEAEKIIEPAVETHSTAQASEVDDLPSEPSDAETDAPVSEDRNEADKFIETLSSMETADDVRKLTNEYMNDIMKLPKADQDRAEAARIGRMKEIAEASISG